MTVYDLIFIACLHLNQGATCKQQMLDCVLATRDQNILEYSKKTDFKKQSAEEFLSSQPQADWQAWVLDCALKPMPTPTGKPMKQKYKGID